MEKLKRYELNCNIFDVYDYDGLSMQELLCQFFTKINECVDLTNTNETLVNWLVDKGLSENVSNKINNMIVDGTIKNLLNVDKIANLEDKINNLILGATGDGNNAEVVASRGGYKLLNERIDAMSNSINVLVNNKNVFNDRTLQSVTSWTSTNNNMVLVEGTNFSNALYVNNSKKTSIFQDITSLQMGDYNFSMKCYSDGINENLYATVSLVGYPTELSSNGTVIHTENNLKIWDYEIGTNLQYNTFKFTLSTNQYNHYRVIIELRNYPRIYKITELYLGLDGENNDFSYISSKLENNSSLNGKSLYLNGDSITFGAGYEGGYGKLLSSKHGCINTNNAISGGTLASGTTYSDGTKRHYIAESVVNSVNKQYDYIILSGGFNDYGNNVPIGELSTSEFCFTNPVKTDNVVGALETMFRHILKNYPTTKLYYLITHKVNRSMNQVNSIGKTMQDYVDAIKSVCEMYSIPVINVWEEGRMLTAYDNISNVYTVDGDRVHPNLFGYNEFYLPVIEKELGL